MPLSAVDAQPDSAAYAALADLVRSCERDRRPLWSIGGATLLGQAPAGATRCELRPLNSLLAHAADDMTITVQSGMTIAGLNGILAQRGQHLPLDVPSPQQTTVGGLIATNLVGPHRFTCGSVRDLLLGIAVIGAAGELIRGGGRVVKNVAGYDLCKLYTGSWGCLGVIVEATFRVAAAPESAAALAVPVDSAPEVEAIVAGIWTGPLRPASVDLLSTAAFELAPSDRGPSADDSRYPAAPYTLLLGFEGPRTSVDWLLDTARRELPAPAALLDAARYAALRQSICDLIVTPGVYVRFSLRSSDTAAFCSDLAAACPRVIFAAQIGSGVVGALFPADDLAAVRGALQRVTELGGGWLIPRADALGCGISALADVPMIGPPRPAWQLMRKIKQTLDPADIFNAGTVFTRSIST